MRRPLRPADIKTVVEVGMELGLTRERARRRMKWALTRDQYSDEDRAAVNGPRWREYIDILDYIRAKNGAWVSVAKELTHVLRQRKGRSGTSRHARRIAYTLAAAGVAEIGISKGPGNPEVYIRAIKKGDL